MHGTTPLEPSEIHIGRPVVRFLPSDGKITCAVSVVAGCVGLLVAELPLEAASFTARAAVSDTVSGGSPCPPSVDVPLVPGAAAVCQESRFLAPREPEPPEPEELVVPGSVPIVGALVLS
uniref:Uncharacterized protein n=1 Tax=Anopheles coluzzii TaxID=1518534 RepID=A0A8W7PBF1_ANOCL